MAASVLPARHGALPPHADPEDLLNLTLHDDPSASDQPDWTADLEDLVSIQVAKQLHSKRSQSALAPYTPPSRSLTPTSASPTPATSRFAAAECSPSYPAKPKPSGIPRAGGSAGAASTGRKSRSVSPDVRSVKGSPLLAAAAAEGGWETLQVGTGAPTSTSPPTLNGSVRARKPSETPAAVTKPLDFPAAALAPSGGKLRAPLLPVSGGVSPPSSGAGTPRKRAVTQSPSVASPSPSALAAARRRAAVPANSLATPSASPAGGKAAPRRHKSISTSTPSSAARAARRSPSSDRLRAAAAEAADEAAAAMPPWSDSRAPLVYRTSRGDLAFAYDGDGGAAAHGRRPEDRVLPAVARRLEAERLARLALEGAGAEGTLVSEWSREGMPRRAVELVPAGARRTPERAPVEAGVDVELEGVPSRVPVPHDEVLVGTPPRTSSRPLAPAVEASPAGLAPAAAPAPSTPSSSFPPATLSPLSRATATAPAAETPSPRPAGPYPGAEGRASTRQGTPPSPPSKEDDAVADAAATAGCCRCVIC